MTYISYTPQEKLIISLGKGHYEEFKILLQDPSVDPSVDNNRLLTMATCNGSIQAINLLLNDSRVDPSFENNLIIRCAELGGHLAVVERLLQDPKVDPNVFHTSKFTMFRDIDNFSEESIGILSAKLVFPANSNIIHWKPSIDKYREELLSFAYDIADYLTDDIIKFIIFPLLFGIKLSEYRALDEDYAALKITVM
jgi:hypothetical protein